jgi:hypothetical protein
MVDGIADRRRGPGDADLADALAAARSQVRIP